MWRDFCEGEGVCSVGPGHETQEGVESKCQPGPGGGEGCESSLG